MSQERHVHITGTIILCGCALANGVAAEASKSSELIGHWRSVDNMVAVNDVTNVDFYVYDVLSLDRNTAASGAPQEFDGQFWLGYKDGQHQAMPWSVPVIRLNDLIRIGSSTDRYNCIFNRSNSTIVLEDLNGQQFKRTRLERVSRDPGPRRELPETLTLSKRLHARFVGIWQSRAWSCNMPEFLNATNVVLTIYRLGRVFTDGDAKAPRAYLECDFRERGSGRLVSTGVTPWPLLEGSHLSFGMSPAGFILSFAFESDLLVLKRREGTEHLEAKFERAERFPGEREPK